MNLKISRHDNFEVSPRFRQTVEERIATLERDAAADETMLAELKHEDHIRRHRKLVAVQRAEALRMRLFLDHTQTRFPRPFIAL
jgi:ribosome-associated translation inhibitor RaiA